MSIAMERAGAVPNAPEPSPRFEGEGAAVARRLTVVADRYRPRVARVFREAFRAGRAAIDMTTVEILSGSGFQGALDSYLERALVAEESVLLPTTVPDVLLSVAARGAAVARQSTPRKDQTVRAAKRSAKPPLVAAFDRTNPKAVEWAHRHGAKLVTEITGETRKAIRSVVSLGISQGIPPKNLARILVNVISMTEAQANAVVNLHQKILTSPGKLVHAGKTAIRVPAGGMDSARLDRVLQSYADRLTRQRALMIARTETIAAANEGQTLLWQQAQERGELPAVVRHQWMAAASERTCPICSALDGETVALGEEFSIGVTNPPAHPMCRCTTGLVN